jgi:hypothetical protein
MQCGYDIFEKFPDGSTLWRAWVTQHSEAQRTIQHLEKLSENQFFTIDIQAGEILPFSLLRSNSRPAAKRATTG